MEKTVSNKANISIRIDAEIKNKLEKIAESRGMDLSKLARVVLVNFVNPGTYSL